MVGVFGGLIRSVPGDVDDTDEVLECASVSSASSSVSEESSCIDTARERSCARVGLVCGVVVLVAKMDVGYVGCVT